MLQQHPVLLGPLKDYTADDLLTHKAGVTTQVSGSASEHCLKYCCSMGDWGSLPLCCGQAQQHHRDT